MIVVTGVGNGGGGGGGDSWANIHSLRIFTFLKLLYANHPPCV